MAVYMHFYNVIEIVTNRLIIWLRGVCGVMGLQASWEVTKGLKAVCPYKTLGN